MFVPQRKILVGFIFLALSLAGCAGPLSPYRKVDLYGIKYFQRELYPPEGDVIPSYYCLEGEMSCTAMYKVLYTLPPEFSRIYLTKSYLFGIEGIMYRKFLEKFADPKSPLYSPVIKPFNLSSPEAQKALEEIHLPVVQFMCGFPPDPNSDDIRAIARCVAESGNHLNFLMDKNIVMSLTPTERMRRYLSTLSEREFDLLKLRIQKKQQDEIAEGIKKEISKQTWMQDRNARELKESIDQLNETLWLRPTYKYYYYRR